MNSVSYDKDLITLVIIAIVFTAATFIGVAKGLLM